ncbi:MAG TPA: mucoidy inhibitor MuiA family protein, partial [Abditibacteriaceae bacterium]
MDIEAPISQVTVFSDRAQVTRRAAARLEAGAQELVIAGLPAGLDENSLRASGSGSVAVKILSVESKERPLEQTPHETARTLKDELQKATDEGQALKKRSEVLEERQKTVRELADNAAKRFAKALAEGTTSLENASQLLDFIQTQTQNINDERAALEKEIRGNIEHQALLQNRLKQLHGARKASDHCVTVALESAGQGEFDLEVSYTVYGARWEPLYDARVQLLPPASPDGLLEGKLQLSYLAKITQNTGEDWKDVTVTLSTAQPHLGSLPPKLSPLYVDIYRASSPPMAGASRMKRKAASDDDEVVAMLADLGPSPALAAALPIEAEHETASVESSGAGVSYELPRRLNVPSDGQPHRGTIAVPEFPVHLDFQAIPRRTEFAYLRATATNDSNLSLLA